MCEDIIKYLLQALLDKVYFEKYHDNLRTRTFPEPEMANQVRRSEAAWQSFMLLCVFYHINGYTILTQTIIVAVLDGDLNVDRVSFENLDFELANFVDFRIRLTHFGSM